MKFARPLVCMLLLTLTGCAATQSLEELPKDLEEVATLEEPLKDVAALKDPMEQVAALKDPMGQVAALRGPAEQVAGLAPAVPRSCSCSR